VKPFIFSDGQPSTLLGVNVDFEETLPTNTPTFSSVAIALWDTATWDNGVWGGVRLLNDWQTCHGVGEYVALRLQVATKGIEVRLKATNYLYEPGAIVE